MGGESRTIRDEIRDDILIVVVIVIYMKIIRISLHDAARFLC
jgi:hypothetical protein